MKLNPDLYETTKLEKKAIRNGFGEELVVLGEENSEIVALTADLAESTRVLEFKKKFPDRFFEVGVAEQNMMGIAAGLALAGKIPFATSYAVFSPGRNWDQLRVSVCYSQSNVKFVSSHSGLTVGEDGATHQALEDIAITRVLPNLHVVVPCDYEQAKKATRAIASTKSPTYLRLGRSNVPVFTTSDTPFEIGKAQVLKDGADITIFATGIMVYESLLAARELEKVGVNAEVINIHTIKPLDSDAIIASAQKTKRALTVEEHQVNGGMGSAVCEVLSENFPVPVIRIGMNDKFGESGSADALLDKYGLRYKNIVEKAKKLI